MAMRYRRNTSLDDSGVGRGSLLILLCWLSAVMSGSRFPVGSSAARCARGGSGSDRRGGLLPARRDGAAGQAGPGRAQSRQQARKAARVTGVRQGELQGALRGDRAGAGPARQPVSQLT